MSTNNLELYGQASSQVNMLLLSQRNMVLVSVFAITITTFAKQFKYNYIKYLSILLFIFAIASGAKSADDFNAYIEDVKADNIDPVNPLNLDDRDLDLIERWRKWVYYSYFLLAIIAFMFVSALIIEWNEFEFSGLLWGKQKFKKKLNKKIN